MKEKVSVGRRFSLKESAEIIAEYESCGLTQREFVEKWGISLATLSNWLRVHREKHAKSSDKAVGFEAVDMSRVLGGSRWAAEVVMPGGAILRLASVDEALTERLVKVLRASC